MPLLSAVTMNDDTFLHVFMPASPFIVHAGLPLPFSVHLLSAVT